MQHKFSEVYIDLSLTTHLGLSSKGEYLHRYFGFTPVSPRVRGSVFSHIPVAAVTDQKHHQNYATQHSSVTIKLAVNPCPAIYLRRYSSMQTDHLSSITNHKCAEFLSLLLLLFWYISALFLLLFRNCIRKRIIKKYGPRFKPTISRESQKRNH